MGQIEGYQGEKEVSPGREITLFRKTDGRSEGRRD